tara:strand:+ start:60 stop:764 length:705 start_codon:yes stop_codon:yes gene_type:complete
MIEMAKIYGIPDSEIELLKKYPNRVKSAEEIPRVHQEMKKELDEMSTKGLFSRIVRWNKKRQLNKFENNKDSLFHAGLVGEKFVVQTLSKLDDDFHVLCGVKIELKVWLTHNGKKNLKSAQMDVVVVSPKGVFCIEVKNWSDNYLRSHEKLSPHEQTERAGKVLWAYLKSLIFDIQVTNVLLSLQGNIEYDDNYKFVVVSTPEKINNFLENRKDKLSKAQVQYIVDDLIKQIRI